MKEINMIPTKEHFASGHRACAGCGEVLGIRMASKAAGDNTIVVQATGCMEVVSTPYPQTSWRLPWIHAAFETAASVASGVDTALRKQGRDINVLVFGGDGATFDIGFQALSGAAERGHNICYVCTDNNAYMNTGIQRSGATPKYAATTTSPAGSAIHGKQEYAKPMPLIMAAHGAYVATANIAFPQDFITKVKKGIENPGTSYIQVYTPCPRGWTFPGNMTVQVCKAAFHTKVTPLYEVENRMLKFTKKPPEPKPVSDYLKMQKRFQHMKEDEIQEVQNHFNKQFEMLERLEECKVQL
jgi:pyruvate ferredoxin oxidoreductase beta subunit